MPILTERLITAGMTEAGAWTRRQLEILGVPWPPANGWKVNIIGKWMTQEAYEEFLVARWTTAKIAKAKAENMKSRPSLFDQNQRAEKLREIAARLSSRPTYEKVTCAGNGGDCPF